MLNKAELGIVEVAAQDLRGGKNIVDFRGSHSLVTLVGLYDHTGNANLDKNNPDLIINEFIELSTPLDGLEPSSLSEVMRILSEISEKLSLIGFQPANACGSANDREVQSYSFSVQREGVQSDFDREKFTTLVRELVLTMHAPALFGLESELIFEEREERKERIMQEIEAIRNRIQV